MTTTLVLSFGVVTVERLSEASKPWVTAYELTGPRVSGVVEIAPMYDEPRVPGASGETAFELLPSAFEVAYGQNTWSRGGVSGTLEVLGSRLANSAIVHADQIDWRFSIRRIQTGIGDYPAPDGATARTREIIRALVELHRRDRKFVYEKAATFARARRLDRLNAIEREYREVDAMLRAIQARHANLQQRKSLMAGEWSFETAIDEAEPITVSLIK
ncbi:hypothetical protein [Actinacidiphila glaucinigra]|uniref:Uncharacterized protein n=1 Tax=Actinacidiphila glaucinigra TaxID=235986 RepID=A0A239F168_9ACTN|nr:hypothetical protein [Actinacidiphila glaucinigra]SNS49902.1 hypothetical protein SAMN05216252_106228 [Actinacidiphila glaucinigra]